MWLSIGAIAWLLRFLSKRASPRVSVEQLAKREASRRYARASARAAQAEAAREAHKAKKQARSGRDRRPRRGDQSAVRRRSEGDEEELS